MHLSSTGFLLGAVGVPSQIGQLHHTRRAEKDNERKAYVLCLGNVAWRPFIYILRVPSKSQASRHGEGQGDWDRVRRFYDASYSGHTWFK